MNLEIDGIDCAQFYREVGRKRPIILYDLGCVREQIGRFKRAFSAAGLTVEIAYSYKTNPVVGKFIHQMGEKMEVTCSRHLVEVLEFAKGKEIVFYSPSLSEEEAEFALDKGVEIIADSIEQLRKLDALAKEETTVGLRINTGIKSEGPLVASGSSMGLLGVPEATFRKNRGEILNLKKVRVVGLHNHLASQNKDLQSWRENARKLAELALLLDKLEYVNIGGGYPIDYQDKPPSIEDIARILAGELSRLPNGTRILTEPGRYIVGPCGTLLAEIVAAKNEAGAETVFLNASIFSVFPDRLISHFAFKPLISPASKVGEKGKRRYLVRGSSPSSVDFFGVLENSPELQVGDLIAVRNIGAYGTVIASSFCGVEKPLEHIIEDSTIRQAIS